MLAFLPILLNVLAPILKVLLPWLFSGSVTQATRRTKKIEGMDTV